MTDMKDESETLNTLEKFASLQKEIAKLKQENKVLHIRAQGVEVLGNCTRTWTGFCRINLNLDTPVALW